MLHSFSSRWLCLYCILLRCKFAEDKVNIFSFVILKAWRWASRAIDETREYLHSVAWCHTKARWIDRLRNEGLERVLCVCKISKKGLIKKEKDVKIQLKKWAPSEGTEKRLKKNNKQQKLFFLLFRLIEAVEKEKKRKSFVSLKKGKTFNEDEKTWFYTNESLCVFLMPFMIHIFITFKVIPILSTMLGHLAD